MPRIRIAYLTSTINSPVMRQGWLGVHDAAKTHGVSLVTIPGGIVTSAPPYHAENIAFSLIRPTDFDGIILHGSSILPDNDSEKIGRFVRFFQGVPLISCAGPLGDIPCVSVGRYQGIYDMMAHLIEHHHYQRIVYLRGPKHYTGAEDRWQGYRDALAAHGIPYQEELVIPVPLSWNSAVQQIEPALQILLEERQLKFGSDIQAILADGDDLALRMMECLTQRGFRIPEDVAVCGFNDIPESGLSFPPMTTVHPPFYQKGWKTLELLLKLIRGEEIPQQTFLPSALVIRQSCGCPDSTLAEVHRLLTMQEKYILDGSEGGSSQVIADLKGSTWQQQQWSEKLAHLFNQALIETESPQIIRQAEFLFREICRSTTELGAIQSWITQTQKVCLNTLSNSVRNTPRVDGFWHQMRILAGEILRRIQTNHYLSHEHQMIALHQIGQGISASFEFSALVKELSRGLTTIGIDTAFLALYESAVPYEFGSDPPEWSRLVFAWLRGENIKLPVEGQRFLTKKLLPDEFLSEMQFNWVINPLYLRDEQIGFLFLSTESRDAMVYEVLRSQMSSALKGVLLFTEVREARLSAEKADMLKTRLLANVSHELRTPLNMIIGLADHLLALPEQADPERSQERSQMISRIKDHAAHQKRVINDLLDLSRAEIGELDLYPEWFDPRPLIVETYSSMVQGSTIPGCEWQLNVPDLLPMLFADPLRLRQILLNLLSNALKFGEGGQIELGAAVSLPFLHIWVKDSGKGISVELQEKIFEPFTTLEQSNRRLEGVGLGLTITRRLVALHKGFMRLESAPGQGSTFHVYLPLPALAGETGAADAQRKRALFYIFPQTPLSEVPCPETEMEMVALDDSSDLEGLLKLYSPQALVWNPIRLHTREWALVKRLRSHPATAMLPFLFYSTINKEVPCESLEPGMTGFLVKPEQKQVLYEVLKQFFNQNQRAQILIVDDDPVIVSEYKDLLMSDNQQVEIRCAQDGKAALNLMMEQTPDLVLLDLTMPEMDGFAVLDWMRANPSTRCVPVLILSNRVLSLEDVERLQQHARVTVQTKGVIAAAEILQSVNRSLFGREDLPVYTSALVKQSIQFIQSHYEQPFSRAQMAEKFGVSEDYLSRVFSREMGIPPWEYLKRYRVLAARQLLDKTNLSVEVIARQTGFEDAAYFSRVFKQVEGMSPRQFRERDPKA